MTHILTVTQLPNEESDDLEYEISGECDEQCRMWFTCAAEEPCRNDPPDDVEEAEFHGMAHRSIEGEWMLPTGRCGATDDSASDDLHCIATKRGLGSHPVEIDYWGDGIWQARDLTPATPSHQPIEEI